MTRWKPTSRENWELHLSTPMNITNRMWSGQRKTKGFIYINLKMKHERSVYVVQGYTYMQRYQDRQMREFSGGPVVKVPYVHCCGPGFNP